MTYQPNEQRRFIGGIQYVDIENNTASGLSRLFGVATTKLVDNATNVTMRMKTLLSETLNRRNQF